MNMETKLFDAAPDGIDTGYAVSHFQKAPTALSDIWAAQLRRGINQPMRQLWDGYTANGLANASGLWNRTPKIETVDALEEQMTLLLTAKIDKRFGQYQKEGLWKNGAFRDDVQATAIISLDSDMIEKAYENQNGAHDAVFNAISNAVAHSNRLGMQADVVINQFATRNGAVQDNEEAERRLEATTSIVADKLSLRGHDIDEDLLFRGIDGRAGKDITFWEEQLDQTLEAGGNSFRFSAEWSRLMTPEGKINQEEFDFFCQMLQLAKNKGIESVICFQHFTYPDWLQDDWSNQESPNQFAHYVKTISLALKGVDLLPTSVLTVNEPSSTLPAGYLSREWPPFKGLQKEMLLAVLEGDVIEEMRLLGIDLDPATIFMNLKNSQQWLPTRFVKTLSMVGSALSDYSSTISNMVDGHIAARQAIKEIDPSVSVGFTHNTPVFTPNTWGSKMEFARSMVDSVVMAHFNDSFWNLLRKRSRAAGEFLFDELGGQYYNEYAGGASSVGANIAEVTVDPRSGKESFMNGWIRMPEGMLIMVQRRNNDIIRDLAYMYRKQKKQHGYIKNRIAIPQLNITESGVPGLSDPSEEIKVILDVVGDAKAMSLMDINRYLAWTTIDDYEWMAAFDAAFGARYIDGTPKPKRGTVVEQKDYAKHDLVIKEAWIYHKRLSELEYLLVGDKVTKELQQLLEQKRKIVEGFLNEYDPENTQRRAAMRRAFWGALAHKLTRT